MRLLLAALCLALPACDCGEARISRAFDAGCRPETCDGTDEDCDGIVDNGLPVLRCGLGACARAVASCVNGAPQACVEGPPAPETCNGLDDDCNDVVDDNLAPRSCGVGECAVTTPACVGGVPQECVPAAPLAEACDGRDNDCDGQVDEALPQVTCGVGACARTVEGCVDGAPQACTPGAPSTEVCDGLDNNCDGQVDEAQGDLTCGVGQCARAVTACISGQGQVCTPGTPGAETCNGLDDDCDGVADNGLLPVTCGVGACARTVAPCVNGVSRACVPGTPAFDVCDGVDNDCDGVVDGNGICNPPIALCPPSSAARVGQPFPLSAQAQDVDGAIASTQWLVTGRPAGSTATPSPTNQASTTFTPDQPGFYTLTFCARDNAGTTTCCTTGLSTTACTTPPTPPVTTSCGTSWDGRPVVKFAAAVPPGLTYQLTSADAGVLLAAAQAGDQYVRPAVRVAPGGPPPGAQVALEVRACTVADQTCCSPPSTLQLSVVEVCATPVAPTAQNLVFSEYVVAGEPGACPSATTCQQGEAIELTNLSHCPVSLDGHHFAYRNAAGSSASLRWMNFGAVDVIPPRGTYVAIRGEQRAPSCAAALGYATRGSALFGLRVSSLEMQGPNLDTGWFNNTGGGASVLQVAPGSIPSGGAPDFMNPVAEIAPYATSASSCAGTGFNAVNSCGEFSSSTPATMLPNQLGRLWHPCDQVLGLLPACVRD